MIRVAAYFVFFFIIKSTPIAQTAAADAPDTTSNGGGIEGRIIGGTDVPFGTYPWFAKARRGTEWGGTLLLVD
jgi:hypothetical protein